MHDSSGDREDGALDLSRRDLLKAQLAGLATYGGVAAASGVASADCDGFSYTPSSPSPGETVDFEPCFGATIGGWSWDFGDGSTSRAESPSHTYDDPGSYGVTMAFTDRRGNTSEWYKTVTVEAADPEADLSISPSNPDAGDSVSLDAGGSTGDSFDWWIYSDGSRVATRSGSSASYVVEGGAEYTFELRAHLNGSTDTASTTVGVPPGACDGQGFLYYPGDPTAGETIEFQTCLAGARGGHSWDFDDGSTSRAESPTHSYDEPGTFTVEYTHTDVRGNSTTWTRDVSVSPSQPKATFDLVPSSPEDGDDVTLDAGEAWGDSFEWTVERDGQTVATPTGRTATVTVEGGAEYTFELAATVDGQTDTASKTVGVPPGACDGQGFLFYPGDPATGETIEFQTCIASTRGGHSWDFDDGSTSLVESPTHSYDAPGTYTVEYTYTDVRGNSTTWSRDVPVSPSQPKATFELSPEKPDDGDDVTLDAGDAWGESFEWTVERDGQTVATPTGRTATVTVEGGAEYTFELTANVGGQTDTASKSVGVPPGACDGQGFLYYPGDPTTGETIEFQSCLAGARGGHSWDFDDGSTSRAESPTHSYDDPGTYTVEYTHTDVRGNDTTWTRDVPVSASQPKATFDHSPSKPVDGEEVTLDAGEAWGDSFEWTVRRDGETVATPTGRTATVTVDGEAEYTFELTASLGGETDVATQSVVVPAQSCDDGGFVYYPAETGAGEEVQFQSCIPGAQGGHVWDFDDGSTTYGRTPTQTFAAPGTYTVEYTHADIRGNETTWSREVSVAATEPSARFTTSPERPTAGDEVTLNAGEAWGESFEWTIERDGETVATPTGRTATVTVDGGATYAVELAAVVGSQRDTASRELRIPPDSCDDHPFVFAPGTPAPGEAVEFQTCSSGYAGVEWEFGDGESTFGETPSHAYEEPGTYDVVLTLHDRRGNEYDYERSLTVEAETPKAQFSIAPEWPYGGAEVTLDASESWGTVAGWEIVEDGEVIAEPTGETHTLTVSAGSEYEFAVTVEVDGQTDTASRSLTVEEDPCADEGFYFEPPEPTTVDEVEFRSCLPAGTGGHRWQFGEGEDAPVAYGRTATHTFDDDGTHTVFHTHIDPRGNQTEYQREITVEQASLEVTSVTPSVEGTPLYVDGVDLAVTYTAEVYADATVTEVTFSLDSEDEVVTVSGPPYEQSYALERLLDADTLVVTAHDDAGNTHTKSPGVNVRTPPDWSETIYSLLSGFLQDYQEYPDTISQDVTVFDTEFQLDEQPGSPISTDTGFEGSLDLQYGYDTRRALHSFGLNGDAAFEAMNKGLEMFLEGVVRGHWDRMKDAYVEGGIEVNLPVPYVPTFEKGVGPVTVEVEATIGPFVEGRVTFAWDGDFHPDGGYVNPGYNLELAAGAEYSHVGVTVSGTGEVGWSYTPRLQDPYLDDLGGYGSASAEIEVSAFLISHSTTVSDVYCVGDAQSQGLCGGPDGQSLADGEAEWSLIDPTGEPPAGPESSNGTPSGDSDVVAQSHGGSPGDGSSLDLRLTHRGYVDERPDVDSLGEEHLLGWSTHRSDATTDEGRDVAVATVPEDVDPATVEGQVADAGTIDRTLLTADADSHHDPVVATDGDRAIAAWTTMIGGATDVTSPADVPPRAEISYALWDGSSWSDVQGLTAETDRAQFLPSVASTGDGWAIAWERADGFDRWGGTHDVRYATVSADGSAADPITIQDAAEPAITASGSRLEVLSIDRGTVAADDSTVAMRHDRVDLAAGAADPTTVTRYEVDGHSDHVARDGAFVWVHSDGPSPTVDYLGDATVDSPSPATLQVPDDYQFVDDVDVVSSAAGDLLTYRTRTPTDGAVDLAYRVRRDGTWSGDHLVASAPDGEHALRSAATAVTPEGFRTVAAIQQHGDDTVSDLFAVEHGFAPSYDVTVSTDPADAAAGDTVTVSYQVRNVGGTPSPSAVPVAAVGDAGRLATAEHAALAPDETATGSFSVTVPERGAFEVVADPNDEHGQVDPSEATVTVDLASPEFAVSGISETRSGGVVTVDATVTNEGSALGESVPVAVMTGETERASGVIESLAPGESTDVSLAVDAPAEAVDGGEQSRVVAGEGAARGSREFWLFKPDLTVYQPRSYRRTSGGVRAKVPIANAGTGPATATLTVTTNGADRRTLVEREVELPVADDGGRRSIDVAATLSDVTDGTTLTVSVDTSVPDRDPTQTATTATVSLSDRLPPVVGEDSPRDPDGDGTFEDLNANGRIDSDDVVTYFENYDDPVMSDHVDAYDVNGNERLDADDVVTLFESL